MRIVLIGFISVLALACGDRRQEAAAVHSETSTVSVDIGSAAAHGKGDLVPAELVCMVNNEYMGKKQLVVNHGGKTYYGCCQMCQKRIPQDVTVRLAIDPYTNRTVDKAEAIIAITGDNGEVSYFENENSWRAFSKQ